jgi:hypothetical protein
MDLRKPVRTTYCGTGLQILEIIEHSYLSIKNRSEMLNILAIQTFYWQPNTLTYHTGYVQLFISLRMFDGA